MKNIVKTVLVFVIAISLSSFTNPIKEKKEVKSSTINWVGKKVTGKHTGSITLQSGYLEMEGEKIVGGEFIIDMTTINVTDLEGKGKSKLEGHLNSDDFFGVNQYPTAKLVVNNATKKGNLYAVNGTITIKGVAESITFNLEMNKNTAVTNIVIDRTKFGIRYGSGSFFDNLGDKTIYDDFELAVELEF